MKLAQLLFLMVLLMIGAPSIRGADVDRSIGKEAKYLQAPLYCLVIFAGQPDDRVWLVIDGDRLFVDCNADGDLTDPKELFSPTEKQGSPSNYSDSFLVGTLSPRGKSSSHTEFKVTRYKQGDNPWAFILRVKFNGVVEQVAGWAPIFTQNREEATMIRFGAPLLARPLRDKEISLSAKNLELHLGFATAGEGKYSFSFLALEAIAAKIHPIAEIQWPGVNPALPESRSKVTLLGRC